MVRIHLIGRLEIEVDGGPVSLPSSRRARALLAWLALNAGAHPRAQVAAQFWPDVLDASARTSLRGALAELRRALGRSAEDVLHADRESVELLRGPQVWIDTEALAALAGAGRWRDALEVEGGRLLAGRLLQDVDEEWVEHDRDEHRRFVLLVLERAAAAAEADGDRAAAVDAARRRARLDPLSEHAGRELVRLLAEAGDRSGALATAAALTDRLRRELHLAPEPETLELIDRLRAGPEPAAVRPADSASSGTRVPLPPAVTLHDDTLVGRAAELATLEDVRRRSTVDGTQVVLVAGDAGIGKTSLAVAAARRAAAEGTLVLHGRCDEDRLVPFGPWVEALGHTFANLDHETLARVVGDGGAELARLLPDLRRRRPDLASPVAVEPDTERWRLFEAVSGALGRLAGDAPALVVVDDAHWADRSSLLLLRHLVRARRGDPLTVVLTCRDVEMSDDDPLHHLLADFHRDHVLTRLALRGLGEAAVGEMVQRRRRSAGRAFVRAVHEETEGNPFFVEEILRNLPRPPASGEPERLPEGFDVPQGVQDVVRRRLGRLPSAVRDTLLLASVLGRDFDLATVEGLSDLGYDDLVDALDQAVAASVVEEVGVGRYSFAHALIRSALYDSLSRTRRARLHLRVALSLEELTEDGSRSRAAETAYHYFAAADPAHLDRAVACARLAYGEAMAQLAYGEAASTARRAADALAAGGRDDAQRLSLLLDLGDALSRGGDLEAGRAAYAAAAGLAREVGDRTALASAALGFAGPSWRTFGQVDEPAVALLREALDRLGDDEPALRAAVAARLAIKLYFAQVPDQVAALTAQALTAARELDDQSVLAAALEARLWSSWNPAGLQDRIETAGELLELAERAQRPELAALARRWRVVALMEAGRLDEAGAEAERHARTARELRMPYELMYVAVFGTAQALLQGRLADARREAAVVADFGELRGGADALQFGGVHAVTLAVEEGRVAELVEPIRQFADAYPALWAWRASLALALAEAGRPDQAQAEIDRLWPPERLPHDAVWIPAVVLLSMASLRLGDTGRCAELYRVLLPYAGRAVVLGAGGAVWGTVDAHLGALAVATGQVQSALAHLDTAARQLREAGAGPALAAVEQGRDALVAALAGAPDPS